jgi:CHASE2 domain-containing sensor protein
MAMAASGYLMLLGVYMAIFMRMSARQQGRPLLHGLLAAGIACAASFGVLLSLSKGSALISPIPILLELVVSFVALVTGIRIRRRHRISRAAGDA